MTDNPNELLMIEAGARQALHADHASHRPLSEGYELIGLIGEAEFARVFKQPLDLNRRPNGDGRVDFVVPFRIKVDVKTARKPLYLIEEQGKVTCDVYVLAQYFDEGQRAELLGWEKGEVLARTPVRDFGKGVQNHHIAREHLRPMADLLKRVMRLT